MNDEHVPDRTIWQSYVYHGDKGFFVSTIERNYHIAAAGTVRGLETLIWEWDADTKQRGRLIHQAGGITDHQAICRSLIATGKFPKEEE